MLHFRFNYKELLVIEVNQHLFCLKTTEMEVIDQRPLVSREATPTVKAAEKRADTQRGDRHTAWGEQRVEGFLLEVKKDKLEGSTNRTGHADYQARGRGRTPGGDIWLSGRPTGRAASCRGSIPPPPSLLPAHPHPPPMWIQPFTTRSCPRLVS